MFSVLLCASLLFFCAYLLRILASYLHTQVYCGFSLPLVLLALQLLLHLSHFCGCTNSSFRHRPRQDTQDTRVFCPLSLSLHLLLSPTNNEFLLWGLTSNWLNFIYFICNARNISFVVFSLAATGHHHVGGVRVGGWGKDDASHS